MPRPILTPEEHIQRVRRMALALPETTEKLSHGEPTFFVRKKVFVMFSNNHHNDGRIAIWIPAATGHQQAMIAEAPEIYFKPPYVGVKGWVGVQLDQVSNEVLATLIRQAWKLIAPRSIHPAAQQPATLHPKP
jgi:hypothetical protein